MRTVEADMDMRNRTRDGKIPLGAPQRFARIVPGTVVRVTDDELEVEAIVEISNGILVAVPRWDTLEYVH